MYFCMIVCVYLMHSHYDANSKTELTEFTSGYLFIKETWQPIKKKYFMMHII